MKAGPILMAAWLAAASMPLAAAQLYQWKDAQGRTVYSDQPPPASVRNVQQKAVKGNAIDGGESHTAPAARKKFPVTLYNTACGKICDHARQYLVERGIAHSVRDPQASPEARAELQKLTGRLSVPILAVGSETAEGFFPDKWQALLDKAGYSTSVQPGRPAAAQPSPATPAPAAP